MVQKCLHWLYCKIVMWCMRRLYRTYKQPICYIRGTGKDYPRYILYTENANVYKRMEDF